MKPPPPNHITIGRLHLTAPPRAREPQVLAAWLRGAVASRFMSETAFHGHDGDKTVSRYPEVHYRWDSEGPSIFAMGAAADHVVAYPWPGTTLRLGDEEVTVAEVAFTARPVAQTLARRLIRYDLAAPWIALNQDNHAKYRGLDRAARRAELDRILVGNLLTLSQAFGWFFERDETLYAAFEPAREVPCSLKGVSLIGLEGSFVTNLDLPSGLAIGRSVSHGFGWFDRAA